MSPRLRDAAEESSAGWLPFDATPRYYVLMLLIAAISRALPRLLRHVYGVVYMVYAYAGDMRHAHSAAV